MKKSLIVAPDIIASHWINSSKPISLSQLRGKVVVIEAFQMLCPGCVSHGLPQASRIRTTFPDNDVVVLGLHTVFEHHEAQGTKAALEAFVHEYRIEFPIGIDARSDGQHIPQTMANYQLRGTPSLILIDRDGHYRDQYFGSVSDMAVGASIMELVLGKSTEAQLSSAGKQEQPLAGCDDVSCTVGSSQ